MVFARNNQRLATGKPARPASRICPLAATLRGLMRFHCLFVSLLFSVCCLLAGTVQVAAQESVPAVMLSDIHFDPFHNPHLFDQLRAAPIEHWPGILNEKSSLAEDAGLAAMQIECHARALDTAWPLLRNSLAAAHEAQPHPLFVTLSGDLLTHQFPCRFHHLAPSSSQQELAKFSAKTVAFVILQLRLAFPHVPIYTALGNNDSGCADYAETPESPFLQQAAAAMRAGINQAASGRHAARKLAFSPEGDYSVALPAPLKHGRLIVLEDIYDAGNYKTCAGAADRAPEAAQITWLRDQLREARKRHEQVWVMGHIPPGIDVYASFTRYILRPHEVCSAPLQSFLADTALADALLDYADIVRLAIFAHTHLDEIRLLHRAGSTSPATDAAGKPAQPEAIPVKLVPSITPYFGNHPAFLVAAIDPRTLVLKDWETFVSPGPNDSPAPWQASYRYSTAYDLPDFSAHSAQALADAFTADHDGKSARAHTYRDHFYAGGAGIYALGLEQVWPAYACAVRENRPSAFKECLCPTEKPPVAQ